MEEIECPCTPMYGPTTLGHEHCAWSIKGKKNFKTKIYSIQNTRRATEHLKCGQDTINSALEKEILQAPDTSPTSTIT
jgi:hypothetical protein